MLESTKFICRTTTDSQKQNVIVTWVSNETMQEMQKYPFTIEVINGRDKTPTFAAKVSFAVYLDEQEESSLSLNGKQIELNCL